MSIDSQIRQVLEMFVDAVQELHESEFRGYIESRDGKLSMNVHIEMGKPAIYDLKVPSNDALKAFSGTLRLFRQNDSTSLRNLVRLIDSTPSHGLTDNCVGQIRLARRYVNYILKTHGRQVITINGDSPKRGDIIEVIVHGKMLHRKLDDPQYSRYKAWEESGMLPLLRYEFVIASLQLYNIMWVLQEQIEE